MVEKHGKLGSPSQRNVSFKTDENSEDENNIVRIVQEVIGEHYDEATILRELRKAPSGKIDARVSNVINALMDGVDDTPSSSCTETKPIGPFFPENAVASSSKETEGTSGKLSVVPYMSPPGLSSDATIDTEDTDLQKALQASLMVSSQRVASVFEPFEVNQNMNLDDLERKPGVSTGLHNAGNTCWFNCVVQALYNLPVLRYILYHAVPDTWKGYENMELEMNNQEKKHVTMRLRQLFAFMRYTNMSCVDTIPILKAVEVLSPAGTKVCEQQDATESFLRLLDWLQAGVKQGLEEIRNQDVSYIPAGSTTSAPNSDVSGTAPPSYEEGMCSVPLSPVISAVKREQESRPNSPLRPCDVRQMIQESSQQMVHEKTDEDEPMDTSEEIVEKVEKKETPKKDIFLSPMPPSAKRERIEKRVDNKSPGEKVFKRNIFGENDQGFPRKTEVAESIPDVTEKVDIDYPFLEKCMNDLFSSESIQLMRSSDNSNAQQHGTTQHSFPLYFQIPIAFNNLHDGLESSAFDYNTEDSSCREIWFEKMPAVIIMALNRYSFNKDAVTETSKKVHSRFYFPKVVYMDRYMKKNESKVIELRKRQKSARERLSQVKAQIKGLLEYPNDDGTVAKLTTSFDTVLSVICNAKKEDPIPTSSNAPSSAYVEENRKQYPVINEVAFPEIPSCLQTIESIKEMLKKLEQDLLAEQADLTDELANLYENEEMREHRYDLHVMIIHSGGLNQGHYWTCARAPNSENDDIWEKYNDRLVETVPWSQVENEAYGDGTPNSSSAYCAIYVRSDAKWVFEADSAPREESLKTLPRDLRDSIVRHNAEFTENLKTFRKSIEEIKGGKTQAAAVNRRTAGGTSARRRLSGCSKKKTDENANPSPERPMTVDESEEKDEALVDLQNSTDRLNYIVKTAAPKKYVDEKQILDVYLQNFISQYGHGFICHLVENIIAYKPENEVLRDFPYEIAQKAFVMYARDLDNTLAQSPGIDPHSNMVAFIRKNLDVCDAVLLRHMAIRALALSDENVFGFFVSLARHDLDRTIKNAEEEFKHLERKSTWCALIFESINITIWACTKSIEAYIRVDGEKELLKTVGPMYFALRASRLARYAYKVFKHEVLLAGQDKIYSDRSINYAYIQSTTILPLIKLTQVLIHLVCNRGRKLEEISFLDELEKRISVDQIVNEITFALYAIKKWISFETTGNFNETLNNFQVRLCAVFETTLNLEITNNDSVKISNVKKIHKVCLNQDFYEEQCPTAIHFETVGYTASYERLVHCFETITEPLPAQMDRMFNEIHRTISNSLI